MIVILFICIPAALDTFLPLPQPQRQQQQHCEMHSNSAASCNWLYVSLFLICKLSLFLHSYVLPFVMLSHSHLRLTKFYGFDVSTEAWYVGGIAPVRPCCQAVVDIHSQRNKAPASPDLSPDSSSAGNCLWNAVAWWWRHSALQAITTTNTNGIG